MSHKDARTARIVNNIVKAAIELVEEEHESFEGPQQSSKVTFQSILVHLVARWRATIAEYQEYTCSLPLLPSPNRYLEMWENVQKEKRNGIYGKVRARDRELADKAADEWIYMYKDVLFGDLVDMRPGCISEASSCQVRSPAVFKQDLTIEETKPISTGNIVRGSFEAFYELQWKNNPTQLNPGAISEGNGLLAILAAAELLELGVEIHE